MRWHTGGVKKRKKRCQKILQKRNSRKRQTQKSLGRPGAAKQVLQ
jgi:hypothetical protein